VEGEVSGGLARFLAAQEATFDRALAEVAAGSKTSHWMWFIFPQLRGLGRSERAQVYGIADRAEAVAYLAHPVLGARLVAISRALLAQERRDAVEVMGSVDALKLRSSMTLFAALPGADPVFGQVLAEFFGGTRCTATLALLASAP
jgi:uncharacterized protein (DUF1810 family)